MTGRGTFDREDEDDVKHKRIDSKESELRLGRLPSIRSYVEFNTMYFLETAGAQHHPSKKLSSEKESPTKDPSMIPVVTEKTKRAKDFSFARINSKPPARSVRQCNELVNDPKGDGSGNPSVSGRCRQGVRG